MSSRPRKRFWIVLLLLFTLLVLTVGSSYAQDGRRLRNVHLTVSSTELLGLVTVPTGTMFADTEIGGLSGIVYDRARGLYYALSDDRSEVDDARFYTVAIDLSDGALDDGDVTFVNVTFLRDENGEPFPPGSLDPESIEMGRFGQLYISSEGDANATPVIDPFVNGFNRFGYQNRTLPIPAKFLPDGAETFGIRDNLAFETLATTIDRRYLYTAVENALHQDGPISTLTNGSPSRVLKYDLWTGQPGPEYVYEVGPIPKAPIPPGAFADHGLVEMRALDNSGTFLAMERSFAVGVGNTILIYETDIRGATDVSEFVALPDAGHYVPMDKRLVLDVGADLGVQPDNLEAMTFGRPLPDGRFPLILVSDNNFNPGQTTQFIAVAVELRPVFGD